MCLDYYSEVKCILRFNGSMERLSSVSSVSLMKKMREQFFLFKHTLPASGKKYPAFRVCLHDCFELIYFFFHFSPPDNMACKSRWSLYRSLIRITSLILCLLDSASMQTTITPGPPTPPLTKPFFQKSLPFITMGCLWLLALIAYIVCAIFKTDDKKRIREIFDDCSPSTASYKYVIRIRIGATSSNFQKDNSAIMLDLIDTKERFITRVSISPSWLKSDIFVKQTEKIRLRTVQFLINRGSLMPQIGAIRVCHDSFYPVGAWIFVHSIEFVDIRESVTSHIEVLKRINILPPTAKETDQVFKVSPGRSKATDEDAFMGGYGPYLSINERCAFLFLYINCALLFSIFYPIYLKLYEWEEALMNGITACLISCTIAGMSMLFYRFVVKRNYSLNRGHGLWKGVKVVYITSSIITSIIAGIAASFIQSLYGGDVSYWSLANFFALLGMTVLTFPGYILYTILRSKQRTSSLSVLKSSSHAIATDERRASKGEK